jgi:predicted ribosome quality control (RQC) complex YloA/Tae2 family protein
MIENPFEQEAKRKDAKIARLKARIIELCDALEEYESEADILATGKQCRSLIEQARKEAT